MRRLRRRRKKKAVTPQIVAKISIDVTIIPANAPDDSVIDLLDGRRVLEGILVAEIDVVLGTEVAELTEMLAADVMAGSPATLAVHAKAGPASL